MNFFQTIVPNHWRKFRINERIYEYIYFYSYVSRKTLETLTEIASESFPLSHIQDPFDPE